MKWNTTHPLYDALEDLRKEVENHRRLSDPRAAQVLEDACDRLERTVREADLQHLTLAEAARESGYSADQLSRHIREGRLVNVGRKGAPRLRRGDLPRKPGRLTTVSLRPQLTGPLGQVARPAVDHRGGR